MNVELEVKILNIDVETLYERLRVIGAQKVMERRLMRRQVFDFAVPTGTKQWVRVRDEGEKSTITLKRVADAASINGTQELEFSIESFEKACTFLTLCGLIPKAYQENYREAWHYEAVLITIDTWPGLSPFVEIEASCEQDVYATIEQLKLERNQCYIGTIDMVYKHLLGLPFEIFHNINTLTFESNVQALKDLPGHHEK